MASTLLITGATGNIGSGIIQHLDFDKDVQVLAGVRNVKEQFTDKPVEMVLFDFDKLESSKPALQQADVLFLLRPPHISDVKGVFSPLIDECKEAGIKHIVFLSVQGVEKSSVIPHHKIEKLIRESGIAYTFIRPAYFMQNLTGNLKREIVEEQRIFVPAGNAKFNWIDADDIGKATARVLEDVNRHENTSYTITGSENLTFREVALKMSDVLKKPIGYKSPNLLHYFIKKKRDGLKTPLIMVMIMLHFLPRFNDEPEITNDYTSLTDDHPRSIEEFLALNKDQLL